EELKVYALEGDDYPVSHSKAPNVELPTPMALSRGISSHGSTMALLDTEIANLGSLQSSPVSEYSTEPVPTLSLDEISTHGTASRAESVHFAHQPKALLDERLAFADEGTPLESAQISPPVETAEYVKSFAMEGTPLDAQSVEEEDTTSETGSSVVSFRECKNASVTSSEGASERQVLSGLIQSAMKIGKASSLCSDCSSDALDPLLKECINLGAQPSSSEAFLGPGSGQLEAVAPAGTVQKPLSSATSCISSTTPITSPPAQTNSLPASNAGSPTLANGLSSLHQVTLPKSLELSNWFLNASVK
ncbi:hypothetical protein Ciccas_011395, partial [Cichlidogyrus casuarinus]